MARNGGEDGEEREDKEDVRDCMMYVEMKGMKEAERIISWKTVS